MRLHNRKFYQQSPYIFSVCQKMLYTNKKPLYLNSNKMKKFALYLTCLCGMALQPAVAQVENENRIEFELREGYEDHRLAKFGKKGVIMYSRQSEREGMMAVWKLERFDTNLKLDKDIELRVRANQVLDEAFENETELYLFFKSNRGEYTLFIVDPLTLQARQFEGEFPPKTRLYDLKIRGNMAYFDAIVQKNPAVITINTETGQRGITALSLPKHKSKNLTIVDIQLLEKTEDVFVYIHALTRKRQEMFVIKMDPNGKTLHSYNFSAGLENKISSISASPIGPDEYIFTGTYSSFSSYSSEGIYIAKVKGEKKEFIKYYNFLDFDEFLNYLPEKKQEKIEKKKSRKEDRGREMKISYNIANHDIISLDGKYLFIGEAFYPTYRTESYQTVGPNGVPMMQYRTVFDGNQYTHATIAGFSTTGDKLWDKTFEMWPSYKPYYRKKFITTSIAGNKIDLLFINRVKIVSMSFNPSGDVDKKKEIEMLETGNDEDVIKRSYANMDYWYGNNFLAYGNQRIKNKEKEMFNKKRSVFFINKISYK